VTDPLLREAKAAIARGSKSFALASRLFDAPTRARATMLYAWCRHCDDVTDEQELGMGFLGRAGTIHQRVAMLREETHAALNGGRPRGTPFAALRRVADETGLPERYAMDLIAGFEMDADEPVYRTAGQTLTYCYHVAGCVGVMMAVVMGVAPTDRATLERACDLGLAFQLNNIARDVVEDAARGRCYLPAQWLADADIEPGEEAKPWARDRLAQVVARLVGEAERYEASARAGAAALPFRSAWAVLAAAEIYGAIGRKVRAAGPRAWDKRVTTGRIEKLALLARARTAAARRRQAALMGNAPARDGLWTMPA